MMGLRAFLRIWLLCSSPLGPSLTAFKAALALENTNDFFHLLTLPVERPHLCGTEAEPVGGIVLAAVFHPEYLEASGETARRLPRGLGQRPDERLPCNAPMFLELAHKVPPIVPHPCEEGLRGIPRIEEDKLGLTAQAMPGIAQQLSGQSERRGTPCMPAPKGAGDADLPVRPDQSHDRDPAHDLALLPRPDPRGFAPQPRLRLFDYRVVQDEIPASDGEQPA